MTDQDNISIVTVDNAAFFVTDLFRQTFNESPPRDPTHYVAFCKIGPAQFEVGGYYHMTDCGTYGLGGGLCVDPRYPGALARLWRALFLPIRARKKLSLAIPVTRSRSGLSIVWATFTPNINTW